MTKAQWHERISYTKSILRIMGYFGLLAWSVPIAVVLIASEVLGIAEEVFGV